MCLGEEEGALEALESKPQITRISLIILLLRKNLFFEKVFFRSFSRAEALFGCGASPLYGVVKQ